MIWVRFGPKLRGNYLGPMLIGVHGLRHPNILNLFNIYIKYKSNLSFSKIKLIKYKLEKVKESPNKKTKNKL